MPACQVKGPFSVRRPLRELQPGPPLNLSVMTQSGRPEPLSSALVPNYNLICSGRVRGGKEPGRPWSVRYKYKATSWTQHTKRKVSESRWRRMILEPIQHMTLQYQTMLVSFRWHPVLFSAYINVWEFGTVHNKFCSYY